MGRTARPGLALLSLLLAACAPASVAPSGSASASASVAASASVEPAASDSFDPGAAGEMIFRLSVVEAVVGTYPVVTLYRDGRLLTFAGDDALTMRRLTGDGIDAVRDAILATGSFEASHQVAVELLPGVEPPGIDLSGLQRFRLLSDDGTWIEVTSIPEVPPQWFAPSEERERLADLADALLTADFVPADGWIDPAPLPYVGSAYLLFSGFSAFPANDPICPPGSEGICETDVAAIAWPVSLPPEGFGDPFTSADGSQSTVDHCAVVEPAFAQAMVTAARPTLGTLAGQLFMDLTVPWRARNGFYEVTLRPVLPDETASCEGKSLPPSIDP